MPYVAVSAGMRGYEIFAKDPLGTDGFVLKTQSKEQLEGRIELTEEQVNEYLAQETHKSQPSGIDASRQPPLKSLSSGCSVDITVGYTSAALARNGSIISSIGTWVSELNGMIDGVGVFCDVVLDGTPMVASHTESTVPGTFTILNDLTGIRTNADAINYRNSTFQSDVFVIIQAANLNGGAMDFSQGVALRDLASPHCGTFHQGSNCGEWAVVRDDYAYSLRVFAHEVLHLLGMSHGYAYGGTESAAFPPATNWFAGAGFFNAVDWADTSVNSIGVRATTVMGNGGVNGSMCSFSNELVNLSCEMRLPFIAYGPMPRRVREYDWSSGSYTLLQRYFPDFYPEYEATPYATASASMQNLIKNAMGYVASLR